MSLFWEAKEDLNEVDDSIDWHNIKYLNEEDYQDTSRHKWILLYHTQHVNVILIEGASMFPVWEPKSRCALYHSVIH